ncbi:MAG: 3-hydroxyacyl-CoA dehydrogenase NAD-binding domain-containing protein [Bacillota bacterium]|nr:3-hydroxyacyl-CoA dehydrogenase NAD-binding domain-containing protein [Bacillota bacterium]
MGKEIRKVAVIGQGVIGRGWTAFFASRGLQVAVFDVDGAAARAAVDGLAETVSFLEREGLAPSGVTDGLSGRVKLAPSLEEAVAGADYVQEAVAEDYEIKKSVFAAADRVAPPDVILASSSSGLLMSEIQKVTQHPGRCLIAHPINPVYLIPLVELVPGERTRPEALAAAKEFLESLGKVPVVLRREVPGYLENRLTAALWREAIDLVHRGVASVEDVDKTIWAGPGLRYALMGPHLIYHLGGGPGGIRHFVEHLHPAFRQWWSDMSTWTSIPQGAVESLERGLLEVTSSRSYQEMVSWRDAMLVKLLKLVGHGGSGIAGPSTENRQA